ncbi:MAG: endo-1,4-beta-xylanase [Planctomycetia bacterium]|nr:endo-1,4-beta-xylanase [Planctomycetia bacterium]
MTRLCDSLRLVRPLMWPITFLLPNPVPAAAAALLRDACFAGGYDQTPVPTTVRIEDGRLILLRNVNESGYLSIPWSIEPFGTLVVSSAALRDRPEPYQLLVELARGKLNQIRCMTAEWQAIGLTTTPDFDRALSEITRLFVRCVLAPTGSEADAVAARVLEQSHMLADQLARNYIEQALATRHEEEGKLPTRVSARLTHAPTGEALAEYTRTFNAATISFRWRDVEPNEAQYDWTEPDAAVAAAKAAGLPITIGPVIDLAPGMLPTWAAGWESDLPALAAFMCDYLETAITRYKDDVKRWVVCAGFNQADSLGLVDDDRLRLAFRLFEAVTQIDPNLELVLSVAQPWGDYLVSEDQTISPITFPDDLVRAGARLSGVELELHCATRPRGSLPRDLLDSARLLDLFGLLGLPLELVLSHPSASDPDPLATAHGQSIWSPAWSAGPSPESQAEWGSSMASLALCWLPVRAVTWAHWSDATPHMVPQSGLLDAHGQPKPLLAKLRNLRSEHLPPERSD